MSGRYQVIPDLDRVSNLEPPLAVQIEFQVVPAATQVDTSGSFLETCRTVQSKAYFRPILLKNSLDKPLAYRRNAIFFGFSLEVWQAS